eukprot:7693374-Alexandrium_andersonii.AAC.1
MFSGCHVGLLIGIRSRRARPMIPMGHKRECSAEHVWEASQWHNPAAPAFTQRGPVALTQRLPQHAPAL